VAWIGLLYLQEKNQLLYFVDASRNHYTV